MIKIANKIIEFSFYLLLLLVPLSFWGDTSELFEFNKMWVTFILTIIITAAWITKMLVRRRFAVQKTLLDIPILLFLSSQIISTMISWDSHISLWGYYTRWNGGLLSTIAYILLYYAFVSNVSEFGNPKNLVKKLLGISLIAGLIVALWGLPSHFGYDPTCLLFRGHLDVSCWTADFQPVIRMFSTLGQPDWLAAYLAILIPVAMAICIPKIQKLNLKIRKNLLIVTGFLLVIALFYAELNFTLSRSGYLGIWAAFLLLAAIYIWKQKFKIEFKGPQVLISVIIILISLFVVNPFPQIQPYTPSNFISKITAPKTNKSKMAVAQPTPPPSAGELGGSDSGKIRGFVWQGALDITKNNPIFGTGVETFAFAYYKYKPAGHNLTSEWDFLYNKAHNEYLNMAATTGIFGLGTYLWMIFAFLWISWKLISKFPTPTSTWNADNFLTLGLVASYITILITDFLGFSVVITNIFLFIIPTLVIILNDKIDFSKQFAFPPISSAKLSGKFEYVKLSKMGWVMVIIVWFVGISMINTLYTYWLADKHYYLGSNYDKINQYVTAYKELHLANQMSPNEPVFADEMSFNDSVIAIQLAQQKQASDAAQVAREATNTSDALTTKFPNNLLFWKTRTRIFYTLSQADTRYLPYALQAIQKAQDLAPTDAKIGYNLSVLYAQNGDLQKAIDTAKKTIELKPNYKESHYALALFYRELAVDSKGKLVNYRQENLAVEQLRYILNNIDPKDQQTLDTLKNWGET